MFRRNYPISASSRKNIGFSAGGKKEEDIEQEELGNTIEDFMRIMEDSGVQGKERGKVAGGGAGGGEGLGSKEKEVGRMKRVEVGRRREEAVGKAMTESDLLMGDSFVKLDTLLKDYSKR
jgi:hypothetical protein